MAGELLQQAEGGKEILPQRFRHVRNEKGDASSGQIGQAGGEGNDQRLTLGTACLKLKGAQRSEQRRQVLLKLAAVQCAG